MSPVHVAVKPGQAKQRKHTHVNNGNEKNPVAGCHLQHVFETMSWLNPLIEAVAIKGKNNNGKKK